MEQDFWSSKITKERVIHKLLDSISDQATRRLRGVADKEYLISDLEAIEHIIPRIRKVLDDERAYFTEFEIEQENLSAFSADINRVAKKKMD